MSKKSNCPRKSDTSLPKGYKQTKIGVIPIEWSLMRTDKVLERIRKKVTVDKNTLYQQIGIRSHAKGIFHKELVSGEILGNKSVFWIEEDCFIVNIVFAWEQAVAKTTHAEKGMIASHRFPMYQPKNNQVDIDYILYFFKSKRGKYLLGLASPGGAGRNKTLGQKEFAELKIPIPLLKEQQKIAKILTTWDRAIERQEALVLAKEEFKKGLIQRLLSGDWDEVRLKEVISNFIVPMRDKPKNLFGNIPWCRIEDFNGKYLTGSKSLQGVTQETVDEMNLKVYPIDTLLVSCSANLGRCAIVKKELITNQTFIGLVRIKEILSEEFLYYLMIYLSHKLNALSSGTTISYLSRKEFENFKIKLPPLKEQQKTAQILTTADKEIELLKNELEVLRKQKRGLMQRLLMGEVRVKE